MVITAFALLYPVGGQSAQCVLLYVHSLAERTVMLILPLAQGRLLQAGVRVPRRAGLRRALLPLHRDVALAAAEVQPQFRILPVPVQR